MVKKTKVHSIPPVVKPVKNLRSSNNISRGNNKTNKEITNNTDRVEVAKKSVPIIVKARSGDSENTSIRSTNLAYNNSRVEQDVYKNTNEDTASDCENQNESDSSSESSSSINSEDDNGATSNLSETRLLIQHNRKQTIAASSQSCNIRLNDDNGASKDSGTHEYVQDLVLQGRVSSPKENKQLIKGVLPTLFGVCKFLESNNDLEFNGTISKYFFHHLNIIPDQQEEWWKSCSNIVRKAIDNKRASVGTAVKKEFMSKYFESVCVTLIMQ